MDNQDISGDSHGWLIMINDKSWMNIHLEEALDDG